jgi:hypothetical protein
MEHRNDREFFVADAYWLPPEGPPLGPMALEVTCRIEGPATRVRVRQSGRGTGARWERYFGVIGPGWMTSLRSLKTYIEAGPARAAENAREDKKAMARISRLEPCTAIRRARRKS